jgi:hypothetical protein
MMPSRLVTGIAVVAAVGVGSVAGALVAVPSLSGASTFPGAIATATPATAPGTTTPPKPLLRGPGEELLEAAAQALHLTPAQLREKLSDGKTTIADVARQQGVDVNTVIDAMVNADRDRITNIVNNPLPQFDFGPNGGPGKAFGPRLGFGILNAGLDNVAKALGITTDELKTDLAKGMSIADIAKSKNVDVNKVIDQLVADASAKIDRAVQNGRLTQSQADQLKSAIRSAITALVNNSLPDLPAMKGGGRFHFGLGAGHAFAPFGPGANPGSAPTTTTTVKPPTS